EMRSSWKLAIAVLCIAAITWRVHEAHATDMLSQNARTCRERAEQGDAAAQIELASMYYHGQGVPQDYGEALRWYRKAADHGYAESQYNLGYMYYYGRGVTKDRSEAERWYQKAADQGNDYAQRALGLRSSLKSGTAVTLWAMFL